jgi:hypothetical protein
MSITTTVITTILILCVLGFSFWGFKLFVLPEDKRRKRYNKKLLNRCVFCKNRVPKDNNYIAGLTERKFNQNSARHAFHPNCVKKILEDPESYIKIDPIIVQQANHCYDEMKYIVEKIQEERRQKKKHIESIISEAKTKNLDFFLEESKGADFK